MICEKFTFRPQCVKCGHDRASWTYNSGELDGKRTRPEPDYLTITCDRCQYQWRMLPRDTIEDGS